MGKFDGAKDPTSDTWATLVSHITGYPVPDRAKVFESLQSSHGGKLFRMEINDVDLSYVVEDSGFLVSTGEDYDIWFFNDTKDGGTIKKARIVFEGRVKSGDEIIFDSPNSKNVHDAQVHEGNDFTDYHKDKFSTIPLARYMNGPRAALLALLDGSTQNARFSNLGVPEADAVHLDSFNTLGDSFDYAAKFFRDQLVVLKDWEDRFGKDDASWKGDAAEVFRNLLKKIRRNYDDYVETFDSQPGSGDASAVGGSTVYSRALHLGRKYMVDAANKLLDAWLDWANSPYYDPHRVLRFVLDDLAQWVDSNNVALTDITSTENGYTHAPKAGFLKDHPDYGDLTDIKNWAKVGDKAVKVWSQGVDEYLGKPAAQVQSDLNNHFLDLGKDFTGNIPKPHTTTTAADDYAKKKAKEEADEIKKENEKAKEEQKKLNDDIKKQNEKAKADQDKLNDDIKKQNEKDKEEQAKKEKEAHAYEEKIRKEQEKQRAEDKAYQEKIRNEQNNQRTEDKAYQEKIRKEQEKQNEEAKNEAKKQADAFKTNLAGVNGPNGDLSTVAERLDPNGDANRVFRALDEHIPSSTAPQNLGSFGNVNGGSGGHNTSLDDANHAIGKQLGSLGDLNKGAGGTLKTPTGGSTQLDGGKLTTGFPDGSSTSFDPKNGVLTTTHPDGSTTTQHLGDGVKVTNPDGSVTSLNPDGKLTTTFPDGTKQVLDPATGQTTTTQPDGTTTHQNLGNLGNINGGHSNLGDLGDINSQLPTESHGHFGDLNSGQSGGLDTPTGGHTSLVNDDFSTTFPDGSKAVFDPNTGSITATHPDGSTTTTDLTHGAKVTNSDGSTTFLDHGKLTTKFPDGSTQVIDPDTGVVTSTDPQGHTRTVDLHDLNSPNIRGGSGNLGDLGDLGNLNGSGGAHHTTSRSVPLSELGLGGGGVSSGSHGGGFSGTNSFATGGSGSAAPLSEGVSVGAGTQLAGATGATAGTPGAPGTPGSPGMPMGGGGAGGMGGGGEKGNGERVRAVLVDAAEESERRNRRRRSPWNRQEDSDTFLAPSRRVSTTGGDAPEEEAEPNRRSTSSADYLEEDADVWGIEEGGTPAVIGR
ncbi:AAWKG family protein [Streptomyces sp. NPDC086787]|uniref:AAWKG family protein n=1 Tax=Streptomyces sp. NPDC086787 TaxID=3365759 RepID=UPI0037FDADD6